MFKTDDPAMTWTCMFCRMVRPESAIEVVTRWLEEGGSFPGTRVTLRYCADNPSCVREARAV